MVSKKGKKNDYEPHIIDGKSISTFRYSGKNPARDIKKESLRVLVAYYSETGNTEKVAYAIYEEISNEHKADLRQIKDVDPKVLNNYDLVFLGSACHSSDLAPPVKKLLNDLPESPRFKLAGFFTHSTWKPKQYILGQDYFDKWASQCIGSFESNCREKHVGFMGYYNCQGSPSPQIEEFIRCSIITSTDEWDTFIQEARKHPNQTDFEEAKIFARKMLKSKDIG